MWTSPPLQGVPLRSVSPRSMDWFKGKFTGLNPIFHGNIDGFRWRFSRENQSVSPRGICIANLIVLSIIHIPGKILGFAAGDLGHLGYSWWLVGGWPTPPKNEFVSWDDYPQYMEKTMFQTTNQGWYRSTFFDRTKSVSKKSGPIFRTRCILAQTDDGVLPGADRNSVKVHRIRGVQWNHQLDGFVLENLNRNPLFFNGQDHGKSHGFRLPPVYF